MRTLKFYLLLIAFAPTFVFSQNEGKKVGLSMAYGLTSPIASDNCNSGFNSGFKAIFYINKNLSIQAISSNSLLKSTSYIDVSNYNLKLFTVGMAYNRSLKNEKWSNNAFATIGFANCDIPDQSFYYEMFDAYKANTNTFSLCFMFGYGINRTLGKSGKWELAFDYNFGYTAGDYDYGIVMQNRYDESDIITGVGSDNFDILFSSFRVGVQYNFLKK